MRFVWAVLVGMLMVVASAQAHDPAPAFVSLFNGRNLDGWVVMGDPKGFRVEEGCIHSDGGQGGNWIRSEREYGNFVLRMQWMLSKTGNSGIFIREGGSSGRPGFEVQLLAPWTPYRDDLHCTGSMYGHVAVDPRPDETTLRWRQAEITCTWKHVSVKIDGVECSRADYDQVESMKDLALRGYVGMQDSHTGAGEWVRFRNIEILDLDQDPDFVVAGLTSEDPAIRRAAYDLTPSLGDHAVPGLLSLVEGDDPAAAHAANLALFRIAGTRDEREEVSAALIARLRGPGGPENRARVTAARLLGLTGGDERATAYALKQAVLEGGPVSEAALEATQRIPDRRMTDALISALHQTEREQQPAILLALGAQSDPRALAELTRWAHKTSRDHCLAAVEALGRMGDSEAIPVLQEVEAAGTPACQRAASNARLAIEERTGAGRRGSEMADSSTD